MSIDWEYPKWLAPSWVQAFTTSRNGGFSKGVYATFNLSYDVGDFKELVDLNREKFSSYVGRRVPFLHLEHGTHIIDIEEEYPLNLQADGAIIRKTGLAVAILTADCLPVFFSDARGSVAGIAHAGWRGLAGGILPKMVRAMGVAPDRQCAHIGPAINAFGYYVGKEVFTAITAQDESLKQFFTRVNHPDQVGKAHCDLIGIARAQLSQAGVRHITECGKDTLRDQEDFFSYRRDGITGRMASLIRLLPPPPEAPARKLVSMKRLTEDNINAPTQAKFIATESVDFEIE